MPKIHIHDAARLKVIEADLAKCVFCIDGFDPDHIEWLIAEVKALQKER